MDLLKTIRKASLKHGGLPPDELAEKIVQFIEVANELLGDEPTSSGAPRPAAGGALHSGAVTPAPPYSP